MKSRRRILSIGCASLAGIALRPASAQESVPALYTGAEWSYLSSLEQHDRSPSGAASLEVLDDSDWRPVPGQRILSMRHMHTGEFQSFALVAGQGVSLDMARRFNRFMRDHHSGTVGNMDPSLIEHLLKLQDTLELRRTTFEVLSAYRSEKTNAMLRRRSVSVARNSMHLEGRAVDINIPGVKARDMFDAALDLKVGGVGLYRRSQFIHFDTGPVRHWS